MSRNRAAVAVYRRWRWSGTSEFYSRFWVDYRSILTFGVLFVPAAACIAQNRWSGVSNVLMVIYTVVRVVSLSGTCCVTFGIMQCHSVSKLVYVQACCSEAKSRANLCRVDSPSSIACRRCSCILATLSNSSGCPQSRSLCT